MKRLIIIPLLICLCCGIRAAAQNIDAVLEEVERNNPSLEAMRKLTDAQVLEARTGNSLPDPEIEYIHAWGKPSAAGKTGELTVTQSFELPVAYANRSRLARTKARQYGYEYEAFRQGIMLEAYTTCIDIIALRLKSGVLAAQMVNAESVVKLISDRVAAGDAGILEENMARYEHAAAQNEFHLNQIELSAALTRLTNLNGGEQAILLGENFPAGDFTLGMQDYYIDLFSSSSPEILSAVTQTTAAAMDVKVSRNAGLPKVTAGYRHEFSPGEKFNGLVVGMSIPMFGNRNNVKRARAQAAYAEAAEMETRQRIQSTVIELWARAEILSTTLNQYAGLLEHDSSARLLQRALDEGYISITEYYTQLDPVLRIQLTYIDLLRDFHTVMAALHVSEL